MSSADSKLSCVISGPVPRRSCGADLLVYLRQSSCASVSTSSNGFMYLAIGRHQRFTGKHPGGQHHLDRRGSSSGRCQRPAPPCYAERAWTPHQSESVTGASLDECGKANTTATE